jgi:hypothetical protein
MNAANNHTFVEAVYRTIYVAHSLSHTKVKGQRTMRRRLETPIDRDGLRQGNNQGRLGEV